jgi:hypothetical protein
MDVIVALGHIAGAIVATIILGMVMLFIGAWEGQRNQKRMLEEVSIQLGKL